MIPDLVSVVIPVFNRPIQVIEAVDSVFAQTYRPIEIIVIDDGSSDETPQVLSALATAHPEIVRVVRQTNQGVGRARQAGLDVAHGEFVQYLDSDDILLPDKLLRQTEALRRRSDCAIAFGRTQYRTVSGAIEPRPEKSLDHQVDGIFPSFLICRWWETGNALFRKKLLDIAGPWLPISSEEDWEYDCRIGALRPKLVFCDHVVIEVRDHAGARLSGGPGLNAAKLRDRAIAHEAILNHARRAGVSDDSPEIKRYARELFLLSRQSGAAGLPKEARRLFDLASTSGSPNRGRLDFRAYRLIAALIGWQGAGTLACAYDRFVRNPLVERSWLPASR
jgi:glycosyltransferase involved in cell wall biosynthesis